MSTAQTDANPADSKDVAPMRRQYLQIKSRYPEHILMFRMGDFYETFDNDAIIASEVLDIVLTGRDMGKGVRVPLAGIPYHAADGYLAKLISAGHKVAICEQIGEVTKGKKLVERDVTRVVTPGTIVDPAMLDARTNNYIAAIVVDGHRAGIAHADITTGEFLTTEIIEESQEEALLALGREILRLRAAEIVVSADFGDALALPQSSWIPETTSLSRSDAWRWTEDRSAQALMRHFNVDSLDGFGATGKPFAIRAAGGLLQYLEETQLSGLQQITALGTYSTSGFMTLDSQTRRNLELTESARGDRKLSLTAVLDHTRTPMGARLLRKWIAQPLLDIDTLTSRLDDVEWFTKHPGERAKTREILGKVGDIERLANRIMTSIAVPRDLGQLRGALAVLPDLEPLVADLPGAPSIPDVASVADLLSSALVEEPPAVLGKAAVFRAGYASELDGHRARAKEAREWIANLERTERNRTGIKTLKVGYNKVFGYYLEVTQAALANAERERMSRGDEGSALPDDYIPKQTLANATRYFTPQLKEYETLVLTAEDTLGELEADQYRKLIKQLAGYTERLLRAAAAIAHIDVTANLAEVAIDRDYVRPALTYDDAIDIEDGRHPVLETTMPAGEYVPNDATIDTDKDQVIILTGPNMAGKSSWLRQVALITLMAQIGSFVPATRASIGIVDRIFTRIGAQDDISTGQSTFMVEMLEMANILNHATPQSLVVLDEIGRGTSTYDGLAIARAIVEYVHNAPSLGCKTLFATHYHELTELADILPRVTNHRMDVLEDGERVVFLRKVVPGNADKSYGIHVARLAGIPKAVSRRAEDILADLESSESGTQNRTGRRDAMRQPVPGAAPQMQLTFFDAPSPVVQRLRELEVESLTPLDAIRVLFELKQEAGECTGGLRRYDDLRHVQLERATTHSAGSRPAPVVSLMTSAPIPKPRDMTAPAPASTTSTESRALPATGEGRFRRWSIAVADRLGNLTMAQLTAILWISSIVMSLVLLGSSRDSIRGTMNIVENWGAVERVALWQDWLEPVIPRFQLPTGVIAWGFRAAMLAGFIAQVASFVVVMRSENPSMKMWLIGPIGAHILQGILMVPSNSDVFFYEAVGSFAANGLNPFTSELLDWPDHPLIPFNFWVDIGTVYGPHWVNYNRIVMSFVGPDPIVATLVQKALAGIFALALGVFIYWFAKKLSGGNQTLAVAAGVLVSWQPNMILESSGQVHNDPHTVLIATMGLALVILGGLAALRAGIILVAVSVMIKFITLPLFGVLGIMRLIDRKKPDGWKKRIFGNWVLDGIAIAAVFVGAFLPYWDGLVTVEEMLAEPHRLYTHPLWRGIQSLLGLLFPDSISGGWTTFTRPFLQIATIVLSIAVVAWMGYRLWNAPQVNRDPEEDALSPDGLPWWTPIILYGWLFIFLILSFVPVNSHPWYWVWPIPAVAQVIAWEMRHERRWRPASMPTWFWVYMWGNALITLAYHTRIARY